MSRPARAPRGRVHGRRALVSGVPGDRQDPLGHVAQVLDRGRGAAGHADDRRTVERLRVLEVAHAFDLDGGRPGDLAQAGQFLRVRARAAADDDHQVDLARQLHRVFLPADRDRADRVHDLELVGARDHEGRQALELPGRLGGLADEGHPLPPRDGGLPLLFLVDDDRIGCEAEQADDLGVLRRPEQDDRVALLDEPAQFALLLDDPGAGAIDDLEAALVGALQDVRPDAVGPDDDRGAVVHVIELLDGLDARAPAVRGRRPRCGRPGRGYGWTCRRPRPPWPCRSLRGRRNRTPSAWRCGRPGPYSRFDYRTGSTRARSPRRRRAARAAGVPRSCA